MDQSLFIVASGADLALRAQTVHSNNLANASTVGFKADLEYFTSQFIEGEGLATKALPESGLSSVDFRAGGLQSTGNALDVAVDGQGFFAVQSKNGAEAYTRAGEFQIDSAGLLVNRSGLPVLGDGGPIAIPPAEHIEVGKDGTISIRAFGQASNSLAVLDRLKLVNPELNDLVKGEDGLFYRKDGGEEAADAAVTVSVGALENSNVNPVEEMTHIITLARNFEIHMKTMQAAKENDQKIDNIINMN